MGLKGLKEGINAKTDCVLPVDWQPFNEGKCQLPLMLKNTLPGCGRVQNDNLRSGRDIFANN
jgi:hypothetical protein